MTSCTVTLEEHGELHIHFSDLAGGLGVSSLPSPLCVLLLFSFLGVWALLCWLLRKEEGEGSGGAQGTRANRPPTVSQVVTHLLLSHASDLPSCSGSFSYFHVPRSAVFTLLSEGFPAQRALSSKETEIAQGTSVSFPAHKICVLASCFPTPPCHPLPRNCWLATSCPHIIPFPLPPSHLSLCALERIILFPFRVTFPEHLGGSVG